MWRGRAEQPFPGRQDVWEADAPAKLPPPAPGPSNSFLSRLMSFFAMKHLQLSHLVCVLSVGQGWDGGGTVSPG